MPGSLKLNALLRPRAVMLVGASHNPHKPGGAILRNLIAANPAIPIYAINPRQLDVPGANWAPSIVDVPELCDLAIIAIPAADIPDALQALGEKGVRVAVVVSAGLSHANGLLDRALAAAQGAEIRLIGPNCIGLLVPPAHIDASFARGGALPGRIAFLSQSGALVSAVLDWAGERQIGFSAVVSTGDMADVGLDEMITLLGEDDRTDAILIYLEGLADARPFLAEVRALAGRKPVIMLKAGRSSAAARAALSHTGALAGSYDVYRAAFRQYGIVMVDRLEDLFGAAAVLARCPAPAGPRLGIITNGGGAGILAADALSGGPGVLADLSPPTMNSLDVVLPATWSRANPVDIIGDAGGARYRAAVETLLQDRANDAVLIMNCPTALADRDEIAVPVAEAVRANGAGKPVLACWLGDSNARQATSILGKAGIALFETPDEAVRGFSYLVQSANPAALACAGRKASDTAVTEAQRLIAAVRQDGRKVMSELEAKALLAAFGIPIVHTVRARTPADVAQACAGLSAPYVVKIVSPDLTHKSDLGGVALGLADPDAAQKAAAAMQQHIRDANPKALLQGFSVQPMIRRKQAHELFCGIATDPAFGPILMVGAGGTAVEVLADRAIRLAPIARPDAEGMLDETRISHLLSGYRDVPATRREAIVDILLALSDMASQLPDIAELDINPLLADAEGCIALDARVILTA